MDAQLEVAWKWALRFLGVVGFVYLLAYKPTWPIAAYALLGGLLGLPNVIAYQQRVNREARKRDQGGSDR
jgi:hypothetical protein